jgi:hypothetical protein
MIGSWKRPAIAAALMAIPALALAHPHADGDRKQVDRVIILKDRHEGGPGKHVRRFHIERLDEKCEGEATKIDEASGDERTQLFLCHDGKAPRAEQAKRLEKVLERIRSDEHFSAEHRAKIESALQEAIGRLRATN